MRGDQELNRERGVIESEIRNWGFAVIEANGCMSSSEEEDAAVYLRDESIVLFESGKKVD